MVAAMGHDRDGGMAMRVLHVIPSIALVHGGPSQVIRTMERALAAEGVEVETATTDDDGPGRRVAKPLGVLVEEEGARRRYFRKNTQFYTCSWSFARWIFTHVHHYDLVHIHALFSFTSVVAALAAQRRGVPYVVRPLGSLSEDRRRTGRPYLKRHSFRWLEGPIIRRASSVHFASEVERLHAEALGHPIRSAVIPLAVDTFDRPAVQGLSSLLPETANNRVVLFLSRLDPIKNIEALISAFAAVEREIPRLHLVIAGSGKAAYVAKLKEMASRAGITSSVTWPGHVQDEFKAVLLQGASAFVLPSYSENFGVAVAEALAAGLPCIVSQGVALGRQVEAAEAGICVGVAPAEIAEGMRKVFASDEQRRRMAANARALAEAEFSTAAMGRRMRALYESILGSPASAVT